MLTVYRLIFLPDITLCKINLLPFKDDSFFLDRHMLFELSYLSY